MSKDRLINRWKNLNQPKLETLECYICKYKNDINTYKEYRANDIFEAGQLLRYQCPICGVIFGDMRFLLLNEEEINRDYEDLYSYYKEGDTTKYILECLRTFNISNYKNKYILDWGCGEWNNVINILKNEGYNIEGYDKYCKKDYIINKLDKTIKKYDIIYSCNFIEHLINPIKDIKNILEYLNEDGLLIFITPCYEYEIAFTHYHTFFFVDNSLEYLCKELELKVIFSRKIVFDDGDKTIIKVFSRK